MVLVFDFNGTVLDDVDVGIEAVNTMLERRALPVLRSREEYFAAFGFPIEDYYRRLGFDFARESYQVLAHEWVAEYLAREEHAPLRAGIVPLLESLRRRGVRTILLSASEEGMLREQLARLGVTHLFDEVLGRSDIYASDKCALAAALARRAPHERLLFIGDTAHDLAAAEAAGGECILLSGGHSSEEELCALPCPHARSVEELRQMLEDLTWQ